MTDELGPRLDDALALARARDTAGFTGLWDLLAGPVSAFCRSRVGPDVDDLVNEIFLGAFRGLERFDGDGRAFRAYVYRIARNKISDRQRWDHRRRGRALPLDEVEEPARPDHGPEELAIGSVERSAIEAVLDALTDEQREVVVLRFVADMSIADVAAVTDRPITAVKAMQRRALATLRRELDTRDQYPDDPAPR